MSTIKRVLTIPLLTTEASVLSFKYLQDFKLAQGQLKLFTGYLRVALVFMLNGALRGKFNICFSRVIC